jgi:hypothetical protein
LNQKLLIVALNCPQIRTLWTGKAWVNPNFRGQPYSPPSHNTNLVSLTAAFLRKSTQALSYPGHRMQIDALVSSPLHNLKKSELSLLHGCISPRIRVTQALPDPGPQDTNGCSHFSSLLRNLQESVLSPQLLIHSSRKPIPRQTDQQMQT